MQTLSSRWQIWIAGQALPQASELPLRGELFSVDPLASHARTLATHHQLYTGHHSNPLLAQPESNEQSLRAFKLATLDFDPSKPITPAAEWLLDNFYLIEAQIQLARRQLPPGNSSELPSLLKGPSARLLRVYDIVLELIAHVDTQRWCR